MKVIKTIISFLLTLATTAAQAQIVIGGSVYGGGNQGEVGGNSTVTVRAGDINKVYGGARMADVKGRAFVHLDGEHASNYILINYVYGGNDIAGSIGWYENLPTTDSLSHASDNGIDKYWNAFVRISSKMTPAVKYTQEEIDAATDGDPAFGKTTNDIKTPATIASDNKSIYIGQLFAGGNGDYPYTEKASGKCDLTLDGVDYKDLEKPVLDRAYLEILGGSMVYAFGGGNNVTVNEKTVIYVNNPSNVVSSIIDTDNPKANKGEDTEKAVGELLTADRTLYDMGLNSVTTYPNSDEFQIGCFFGGNNKAAMAIQPKWNLIDGKIRNIYSGGNQGDMTSPIGLLLEIPEGSNIEADNVYGGCRRANVHPLNPDGSDVTSVPNPEGYKFPTNLSARVLVRGGDIKNVYGGNDISGSVWGGSAVGIYHSISGDVYGGGNGSYAYTDNSALKDDPTWGDFYYDVKTLLGTEASSWTFESTNPSAANQALSVKALNAHRPNVERTSLRLWGPDADHPTIIGGSVFVGGNSATVLKSNTSKMVQLKIGSHVIADNVFLGNNGEQMVDASEGGTLAKYAGNVNNYDKESVDFSSLVLTDATTFATYMEGAEMTQKPDVVFDGEKDHETYKEYTSYFGSLYCGGNRGSMNVDACTKIDFEHEIIIFDKLVGGCNDAYIPAHEGLNAAFDGGLIGAPPTTGDDKDIKLKLNISGLKIQPKRWVKDENGNKIRLVWNTVDADGNNTDPVTEITKDEGKNYQTSTEADKTRRLEGGNIYGGCYTSGHVNGNVVININSTIIDRDKLFDEVATYDLGEEISLYGTDLLNQEEEYHITKRNTGVILGLQGMDVLGKALNVFGGGKGKDTEIWGSTTINLKKGYVFQVFGGSEEGVIGKPINTTNEPNGTYNSTENTYAFNGRLYKKDDKYSCYINLDGAVAGVSKKGSQGDTSGTMAETEFIYGGAFLGPIAGNTVINLGNGRIFNSFAGSCNGDILGHTETYIGGDGTTVTGFPYIRDYVYGGNDLGGDIKGNKDFKDRKSAGLPIALHSADVTKASAYMEYTQGRALGIFGGCFGTYNYKDDHYRAYFDENGIAKQGYTKPRMHNTFVNFRPEKTDKLMTNTNNVVSVIYGGGQGYPSDGDRDIMQDGSYILIDIPQEMTNYKDMEVFGAGAWSGQGMREFLDPKTAGEEDLHKASAIIDLARGQISSVYGGSYKEGFTRRTEVNVPVGSTIKLGYETVHEEEDEEGNKTTYTVTHGGSLFGGAYGEKNDAVCDVYEANVEYHSADARVYYIYGGNNTYRRTLYGRVNIDVPVWTKEPNTKWLGTVYGAGYGENTWSQYTEVNLNGKKDNSGNIIGGAKVYQAFGGGYNGKVMNNTTVKKWAADTGAHENDNNVYPLEIGVGAVATAYAGAGLGLDNALVKHTELGDTCNTNVRIYRGATVGHDAITKGGYAYGGGQGTKTIAKSGDVNGSTYIAVLGGTAYRDIYAAGTVGAVLDEYGTALDTDKRFVATANAYIAGGSVRNVYGGGYMGSVGLHEVGGKREGDISGEWNNDILGKTNVVIGIRKDQTDANLLKDIKAVLGENANKANYGFYCGVPTVQRNAYGGGEGEAQKGGRGGTVFGTSNITLNNGMIGYVHLEANEEQDEKGNIVTAATSTEERYEAKINDETNYDGDIWKGEGTLKDYGSMFGGGYSDRSNVDFTNVTMWGGVLRGSLHGGAEVAAIGRGKTTTDPNNDAKRTLDEIYKPGGTKVTMYNGHVMRNVFGGGKGYNLQGFGGANGLYTDGYVFGQTEVYIHGGEIGTKEGVTVLEDGSGGDGNVFGGGDIGYVYSKGYFNDASRQTSTGSPGHTYYYYNNELVEDCKVVVSPYLQVKSETCNIAGHDYVKYQYVPTDTLNTLPKKGSDGAYGDGWLYLYTGADKNKTGESDDKEERGVTIHNAVFAGGNVSSKKETYANATTVYGNTSATLYDVYHRDFITVGTEHIGGLYGGGNLSVVDGYRELNITNYGTDYYGLNQQITLEEYEKLSNRERAYFELEYVCQNGTEVKEGKTGVYVGDTFYENGKRIKEKEYNNIKLITTGEHPFNAGNWVQFGFCSIYAGRLLNTIQRADLCGVFGSRMVLQGAKDRVADVADATPYTINRVGELSLNKQATTAGDTDSEKVHGNYFGIYSVVNYLGNLTSDVRFNDKRQVVVKNALGNDEVQDASDGKSYYNWKKDAYDTNATTFNDRNKGYSDNQVALASGVFLELTTENSTTEHKEYGYITGIIELDLINVKQDIVGGGYVYAKNEHLVGKYYPNKKNVILSDYNKKTDNEVCSYRQYLYDSSKESSSEWSTAGTGTLYNDTETFGGEPVKYETSGNFIHRSKHIVDDCYPTNNAYKIDDNPYSEAHYWYIKGTVYIYDQIVSAYTGAANAYSKAVNLPLTITAASNGKLKLLDVKPSKYAYYSKTDKSEKIGIDGVKVNNESETYYLNDVISYWDWSLLSQSEQNYFVDATYVNAINCKVTIEGTPTPYAPGAYVMDETAYNSFSLPITYTNDRGIEVTISSSDTGYADVKKHVFRSSNNIGHNTGYVLTFDVDNPSDWDNWYSIESNNTNSKINTERYENLSETEKEDYIEGPTFRPNTAGVYGRKHHTVGEIITKDVYLLYPTEDQAKVDRAYVAKEDVSYTYQGQPKTINKGTAIPYSEWNHADLASVQNKFAEAKVCFSTLKLDDEKYITKGDLLTAADITLLKNTYAKEPGAAEGVYTELAGDIDKVMTDAYICKEEGDYGGQNFAANTNYSAIKSWCSLSKADRANFNFNYDALDLLIDPDYLKTKSTEEAYHEPYSTEKSIEYKAKFEPTSEVTSVSYIKDDKTYTISSTGITYKVGDGEPEQVSNNAIISGEIYENYIRNEQRHYTKVSVTHVGTDHVYVANQNFIYEGTPYSIGQIITEEVYNANTTKVNVVTPAESTQYYCYEGTGAGTLISENEYNALPNDQQYFSIQGTQPTETTTLYVSSESDIYNLSKEKIITVIYQYTYNEEGESSGEIKTTSELHVVNIHLQMQSGIPEIGPLGPPSTVLPGSTVGMKPPTVSEGLYEILTTGWELFGSSDDADNHRNGTPFVNGGTPVYWHQNGDNYVAYYAKTYLGKTYSNPVPLSVANYHDLKKVMEDKEHHYYIDNPSVERAPKIYINNYGTGNANGLDLLKSLFDLSTLSNPTVNTETGLISEGDFTGHAPLNTTQVGACKNLEFILRTDIKNSGSWAGIGTDNTTDCFDGTLHGDGHTISGLDKSLFNHLCGEVYNLGVTGSFTEAGIVNDGTGYLENCWVKSSANVGEGIKAVFNNPSNTATRTVHLVNCYYPSSAGYSAQTGATGMEDKSFYNGEVAYNLNGFYLFKRYCDSKSLSQYKYKYLKDVSGTLTPTDGYYEDNLNTEGRTTGPYLLNVDEPNKTGNGYVEERYADGDFIYANDEIPSTANSRMYNVDAITGKRYYAPIWPDDYLFFGQKLNYGHGDNNGPKHQDQPTIINRDAESLRLMTGDNSNRVYRAPAYYGSKTMEAAYFNPNAIFAETKKGDDNVLAYKGMTAIDFTGGNDDVAGGYVFNTAATASGNRPAGVFYPPLLDDDGLAEFKNIDLTRNLLVYTGTRTASMTKTNGIVKAYLGDGAYTVTNNTYGTVDSWDTEADLIRGHRVELKESNYVAKNDHLLVDKQDFNCPIPYSMGSYRMWYQRTPDNYVDRAKGWEGISIPFKAETVTTQTKGELTHFYSTSTKGHEYWLRQFAGNVQQKKDEHNNDVAGVFTADFSSPAANSDGSKTVNNTFLWDYYYWESAEPHQEDTNNDKYQEYYNSSRTYDQYPRLAAATPYIIGFPGSTYYEFDLSGTWAPTTTANPNPSKLDPQVITFASATGASIGVSDTELNNVTNSGYTFTPNYMSKQIAAGAFFLDNTGSSYTKADAATNAVPFRPYFTATSSAREKTRSIVFKNSGSALTGIENHYMPDKSASSLNIYSKRKKIVVESALKQTVDISIFNAAGLAIANYSIDPGETIETRIYTSGVYIVRTADGNYIKKLAVR